MKPDLELRKFPIQKVLPALKKINQYVVLHPDEGWDAAPRQACFCGKKSTQQMTKCESCDEWFHHKCTGLNQSDASILEHWKCGYCCTAPDSDGNCSWSLAIPKPKRGNAPAAPLRNIAQTPRSLGLETDGTARIRTWAQIVKHCEDEGRKLNILMMKNRAKAAELVKAAGHHVGDEMSGGGLAVRAVDDRLADEFIAEGLIPGLDSDSED